jgi:hypothetical protein
LDNANDLQMPKKTQAQIAQAHGITKDALSAIKAKGVNIYNDAELSAAIGKQRPRIAANATLPPSAATGGEASAQTIEQMENAIRRAVSFEEVKILKEKLAGLKIAVSVRAESRDLIPRGEVRESITRVVSAARGEILKLASDLPPRVEGLPAAKIARVIHDEVIAILSRLSDETSALYED